MTEPTSAVRTEEAAFAAARVPFRLSPVRSDLEDTVDLLGLIAAEARILHAPDLSAPGSARGKDIDCGVEATDPLWFLRVSAGERVCQRIPYDVGGDCWVVDRGDSFLALDILEDPRGLNRLGFRTTGIYNGTAPYAADDVKAAYLTLKRIYKDSRDPGDWERISAMVSDPGAYRLRLEPSLGKKVASGVAEAVLSGTAPDDKLWARARLSQKMRWARRPWRGPLLLGAKAARAFDRVRHPIGLTVLLAGPDGTGKSTLADTLAETLDAPFKAVKRFHWKPGVLPRPGALLGRPGTDASDPHGGEPHGSAVSLALLAYHWLDTLLGHWVKVWPNLVRGRLVIIERGWWDISIDPRRYGLRIPKRIAAVLGRAVPKPHLALVLNAPGEILFQRKQELEPEELDRQIAQWKNALPRIRGTEVDVGRPLREVQRAARDAVITALEKRTLSRVKGGWTALPRRANERWILPRASRKVARAALAVYQPVTLKGRVGWEVGRVASSLGAARLLPRNSAPAREVRDIVAPLMPRGGTMALSRANHGKRYVALIIEADGTASSVVKVALEEEGRRALRHEVTMLDTLGPRLPEPLSAPKVLSAGENFIAMEAVDFAPRLRPWKLPEEVASALGGFHASGAGDQSGPTHGDCAPWNLLRSGAGWTLIDWEDAEMGRAAYWDVFHYLVQSHALLGNPKADDLIAGLRGHGWCGRVISAYAEAAHVDLSEIRPRFSAYLQETALRLDPQKTDGSVGIAARRALLARRKEW